jgi:hypothetical protein
MTRIVSAAAAAVALGLALSGAAVAQQKGPTVSKAVAKPLQEAQKAMQAKNFPQCIAKTREADAVAGKSSYDEFVINELVGFCAIRTNDYSTAAKALEASLNSEHMSQSDVPQRVRALSQVNYQIKNYPKAIEFGNRAIKGGFADADIYTLVAQAYYIQNDYKGTYKFVNDWVTDQQKRGQTPREQSLQLLLSSCLKLDDAPCVTRSLERLVQYYPKDEYWQNLMQSLLRSGANDKTMLNVYRLASEVNAMTRGDDYREMAQLAMEQGLPGEAQATLEKAFANKKFTEARDVDSNTRLLNTAKTQATADRASLAKQEADALKDKTSGELDVKIGAAYLSYGQYPQAVAALQRGIAEGKLKNPAEAQLLLGIAQLRAGNKGEAGKAFKDIKGDETLARLGSLWALRAS